MNVRKAAEFLGCCRSYVYQLFEAGHIEGYRLGTTKGIRLYTESVKAFLFSRMADE